MQQTRDTSYNGNENLRKPGVKLNLTSEQIEEFVKCSEDPIYFIRNYVKIVSIDEGLIPFNMWPFQEEMVRTAIENRFSIAKMPRQVGKTTTVCAMMLWMILFNKHYQIAILAHKQDQSHDILAKIKLAYEHLPQFLQQGVITWNEGSIELENKSFINASATSSSAIRGGSYSLVYLDEFAFVPNNLQEQFFASVYPVISSSKTAKIFITSTPNGLNMFYKIWHDSEIGKNTYKRVSVHWSDIPGRDEAWKEETIRNTSEDQFRVEFECEFLGSANTLIHPSKLAVLTYIPPDAHEEHFDIYEQPQPGQNYVVVADTARGANKDYSSFVVFDISAHPFKVVAKYRNNRIGPLLYPEIILNFARGYNDAFVLIEINDIGGQVADILYYDYEYENVLITGSSGRAGITLGGGSGPPQLGIRTTAPVKKTGCMNFKNLVEMDKIVLNDYDLLYELSRFIANKSGSYEADEGEHDDLVMCCVLFAWLVNQEYFKEISAQNIRQKLSEENAAAIESEILPIGFVFLNPETIDQFDLEESYRQNSGFYGGFGLSEVDKKEILFNF